MKILALETSTPVCSVALLFNGNTIERTETSNAQHGKRILQFVDELLSEAGLSVPELDAIAFTQGPGSFTGLRISAATAQGLAFAHQLPVIPVSSLQTLAQAAWCHYQATQVLACLDARMHEVYWASYQLDKNAIMCLKGEEQVLPPGKVVLPTEGTWVGVGSGWTEYQQAMPSSRDNITIKPLLFPKACDCLTIAEVYFKQGQYFSAQEAQPNYIRNKVTQ